MQFLWKHPVQVLASLLIVLVGLFMFTLLVGGDSGSNRLALAQAMLLLGNLILVWAYGSVAVAQFMSEATDRMIQNKPVAFTDSDGDGKYRVNNAGGGAAVNIWYLEEGGTATPIGGLGASETRPLPPDIAERINQPRTHRHLLLAQARPNTQRTWTVSMNVRTGGPNTPMVHGFATPRKVAHEGDINLFLRDERDHLMEQLRDAKLLHEGVVS